MRPFSFILALVLINVVSGQNNFTIRGKIECLSRSKSVILKSSYGTFRGEINSDGNFEIIGEGLKSAGEALILTDSSNADAIWLEPGNYKMECREERLSGITHLLFRTSFFDGPQDAHLYFGFTQPFYDFNSVPKEDRTRIEKEFASKYIDSAFKFFPKSKVLPQILRRAGSLIDDETARNYFSLLSNEQVSQPGAQSVSNYLKRKDKIAGEKTFEDFSLPKENGESFRLSSIKDKKLILLDFWASWCGPCRHKNQRLVELYKKYSSAGLEIISVSLDDKKKDWVNAIKKDSLSWINVSELKGWESSLAKKYFISGVPFTILLDKNRSIIATELVLTDEEMEKFLAGR